MKRFLFAMACLCGMGTGASFAATIHVPADYSNINYAIDAAKAGDEIVVSPGTYGPFGIDRNVTVRSTFDGKDWSLVKSTIIKDTNDSGNISIGSFHAAAGATVRGFTLTKDPITIYPGWTGNATGVSSDGVVANVEYCIIENCASSGYGGAISGINGTIQNNIIRNCYSPGGAIYCLSAKTICNNIFYNNTDGAIYGSGNIYNNTIYNSGWVGSLGGGVFNNIFWISAGSFDYTGPDPRNCVIRGYTGSGKNIITADPKFVDPANGDFHLQSTSPCIDAGLTTSTTSTTTPKADISGVQRGLKAVGAPARGDGSGMDIGAYEYIPKPVAVWLPDGGPDTIAAGNSLTVNWQMDLSTAGSAILLRLVARDQVYADFGSFWNATGADETVVRLPSLLPSRADYCIQGVSSWDQSLSNVTPVFSIAAGSQFNAVRPSLWAKYR
jgi:hypothetical protein